MRWIESWRADPVARVIADRHYNRQKVGAVQFVPPGRAIVLRSVCGRAFWVTSFPFARFVRHAWAGAWVCSAFRNEGAGLSSELIVEAVAATRWLAERKPTWEGGLPPEALGFVSFVDASKVRPKENPGYCYLRAGWTLLDERTKEDGLLVYQLMPDAMSAAEKPAALRATLAGMKKRRTRLFRCHGCGSQEYTLAEMRSANSDTPEVVREIQRLAVGQTARFGGGAGASTWVKRVA